MCVWICVCMCVLAGEQLVLNSLLNVFTAPALTSDVTSNRLT